MNRIRIWGQSIAVLAFGAIAVGGLQSPARSQTGLCRQTIVPQGLVVRAEPSPNAARVGGVPDNGQVLLVQGFEGIKGSNGRIWIEITEPVDGYISNGYPNGRSNLIYCPGDTVGRTPEPEPEPDDGETPSSTNLCRRVEGRVAPRGLVVRSDASRFSARVGGVPAGGEVTLVPDYELIPDKNDEPRNWVEITEPVDGYLSANSLIMCP